MCAYTTLRPTLDAEFRRFFAMSTVEKMQIPLSHLALYLMVCSLGCLFRAHKFEMFGEEGLTGHLPSTGHSVDPSEPNTRSSIPKDGKDLTSSRLQSELYRETQLTDLVNSADLSIGLVSSPSLVLVHVLAHDQDDTDAHFG